MSPRARRLFGPHRTVYAVPAQLEFPERLSLVTSGTLPRPLVADDRFILATRDAGYRSLAAAVAELLDNAIQADATTLRIVVREERDAATSERLVNIGILDDGRGMDANGLWTALQFGGTERFDDRSGFGRFGMGLPNSSVSVTRRLEVYSWQPLSQVLYTYLDVDEVSRRVIGGIPQPEYRRLPAWIDPEVPPSGTLVVWQRCDRLEFKKAGTIVEKLRAPLGRMYRRLLWRGIRILINGTLVEPIDPLFCSPLSNEGGAAPYGPPLHYDVVVPGTNRTSRVIIRFARLPVEKWHSRSDDEKRATGIVGGAGISFVRADREIDQGWCLFGGKRKENYDDWWRCEVLFEPALDECFGVTHSKQGVTPTPYLRAILEPDLETIARTLNADVRTAFQRLRQAAPSTSTALANRNDALLPVPSRLSGMGDRFSYRIALGPIATRQFFDVVVNGRSVVLTLNTDHPFYERMFTAFPKASDGRRALEAMLLAAARGYVALSPDERAATRQYWCTWGDALSAFTERPRL